MNKILILFVLLCGCEIKYYDGGKLPDNKKDLIVYIDNLENNIENLQTELDISKKDVEYAEKYLMENPDTVWNNVGSRNLRRRIFERDSTLFYIKCSSEDLKKAKSKLTQLDEK